jgi:hypothetical protein
VTTPAPTPEASTRNWGGRRPGAGAPRGNRNAVRRTPEEDLRRIARSPGFQDLLGQLSPAMRELMVIALDAATKHALRTGRVVAAGLFDDEIELAQRRAVLMTVQMLLSRFADAYKVGRRTRLQREHSAVKVLRPWVRVALGFDLAPSESSQSSFELDGGELYQDQSSPDRSTDHSPDALPSPDPSFPPGGD